MALLGRDLVGLAETGSGKTLVRLAACGRGRSRWQLTCSGWVCPPPAAQQGSGGPGAPRPR